MGLIGARRDAVSATTENGKSVLAGRLGLSERSAQLPLLFGKCLQSVIQFKVGVRAKGSLIKRYTRHCTINDPNLVPVAEILRHVGALTRGHKMAARDYSVPA